MSDHNLVSDAQTKARKPWILNDPDEPTIEQSVMFLKQWRSDDEKLKLYGRKVVRKKVAEGYDRLVVEDGHYYILEFKPKSPLKLDSLTEDVCLELTPEQAQIWLLDHVIAKPIAKGGRLNNFFIGGWFLMVAVSFLSNIFA